MSERHTIRPFLIPGLPPPEAAADAESARSPRATVAAGERSGAIQNLSLAALLMMAGLLLSKITGQLREILIVPILGYGQVSDAFVIGFQIPDLFYQLLIGGAIQAAITPTLAAAIEKRQLKSGWRSVSIFINFAALAMMLAVVAGEFLAPLLITLYNVGKDPQIPAIAIRVTQALFPQTFFMMLAALCIGILNAHKKFLSTSFGPSIYNICVILAMALFGQASPSGAVRVASGVMLAACFYFIMQLWLARRELHHFVFSLDFRDHGFRQLLRMALPTLLSGSIVQINMIILTGFANQFAGAATSLRQASTTWQLPYGIFAVAIGSVMLPSLAGFNARRDNSGSRKLLTRSLRSALFLTIPTAALFLAMQEDTIRAIFQWSANYSETTVSNTAGILRWYCLAIALQSAVFLINQAFYAQRQTRIALINGVITLLLNSLACWILTRTTSLGVSSLSLAYLITSSFSAGFLYFIYRKLYRQAAPRRIWPFVIRVIMCSAVLMLVIAGLDALPVHPAGKTAQLAWYAGRFFLGFAGFLASASLLKMREARSVIGKLNAVCMKAAAGLSWLAGQLQHLGMAVLRLVTGRKSGKQPDARTEDRTEGTSRQALSHMLGKHEARRAHQDMLRERLDGRLKPALNVLASQAGRLFRFVGRNIGRLWRKIADLFKDSQPLD